MRDQLSNNATYVRQNNIKGLSRLKFWAKIHWHHHLADQKLKKTLKDKVCYYGPFKGEFGHMLGHNLPFMMYLHSKEVKIIYCGMELHKPLMVDEQGNSIIDDFRPIRDFFKEVSPLSNVTVVPEDIQPVIDDFKAEAEASPYAFWNIDDDYFYHFILRNWVTKGHAHTYDISKFYGTGKQHACTIFPRGKGGNMTRNNGKRWDYAELVELVKPHFDTVFVCGHPSQSLGVEAKGNVELCISADNRVMLEKTSNSSLVISQHSGIFYLPEYVRTDFMLIYKGVKRMEDIGSIGNSLRFRDALGAHQALHFAFSEEDITNKLKTLYAK